jgi:hypothetical protein
VSTSEYGGRVRLPTARLEGRETLSSHALRVLASNAHHYADQKCNHLVNWTAARTSLMAAGQGYMQPFQLSTSFARVASYGPIPLTLKPDRTAYPVRLELAAASSSGGTNVDFAAMLVSSVALGSDFVRDSAIIANHGVIFAGTTSATPAWLAASSGSTFFAPSQSIVEAALGARNTLTDTSGSPATVDTCEVFLVVYARGANLAVTPRLYGVHLSEYVGT